MPTTLLTGFGILAVSIGSIQADESSPKAVEPKAANSDAPLPEGWPDATEPGQIEVKAYPAYRSAVARAKGASLGADNILFFSLFNHIQNHEIAMTAPVVNTYKTPALVEDKDGRGEMTMEFLYRTPTQGEAGPGSLAVQVEDHPGATFVCLGLQGAMTDERLREGVKTLRDWLAKRKDAWTEAGPPRRLGYHGPMTPEARRRWEVQIPIEKAKPAEPK